MSNLTIRCIYKTDEIGDASFILTNDPIIVTDFKFTIKCDVDSALALSDLAENPVLRTSYCLFVLLNTKKSFLS